MEGFEWHDPQILTYIGLLFGAMTSMIIFYQKARIGMWIKICWRKTFGATHYTLLTEMREIKSNQNEFKKEMHPNGGSSFKDQLNRIEDQGNNTYALTGAKLHVDQQAMFVTDKQGKVTSNNYQHQMLTGFSADQVKDDSWILVIDPVDRQRVRESWQQAIDEQREFSEDIMYVTPRGRKYKVHVKAARQLDSAGKIRGWLGVVTPLDQFGRAVCAFHHERCDVILQHEQAGELS
jgi:PAS domain S-box-containing protein